MSTALIVITITFETIVGLALVVLLILAVIDYFENYKDDIDQYGPKIKFSTFYKAYNMQSERWDITDDDYVACFMPINRQCFHFSYIDMWFYRWWKRMIEKKIANIKNQEIINNMLEMIKQDKENNQCSK